MNQPQVQEKKGVLGSLKDILGFGNTTPQPIVAPQDSRGNVLTKEQLSDINKAENEQIILQAKREIFPGFTMLVHLGIFIIACLVIWGVLHYLLVEIIKALGHISVVLGYAYVVINFGILIAILSSLPTSVKLFIEARRAAGVNPNANGANFLEKLDLFFYFRTYIMPIGILIAANFLMFTFVSFVSATNTLLSITPAAIVLDSNGNNKYETFGSYQERVAASVGGVPIGTNQMFSKNITHVVKSGDTLAKVAEQYKSTVAAIKKASQLKSNNIEIGWKLTVPVP